VKVLWKLIKGTLKTFVLWLVGIVVLMLIQTNLFPDASKDLKAAFGGLVLVYMVIVLVYVVKPGLFQRKKAVIAPTPPDLEDDTDYVAQVKAQIRPIKLSEAT